MTAEDIYDRWLQWRKYFAVVIAILCCSTIALAAYWHIKAKKLENMADIYASLQTNIQRHDVSSAVEIANLLQTTAPKHVYADLAILKTINFMSLSQAESALRIIIVRNNDIAITSVALLQLAQVLIQRNMFAAAKVVLLTKHDKSFDALFYLARGDLYLLENAPAPAKAAYQAALKLNQNNDFARLIQLKLALLAIS